MKTTASTAADKTAKKSRHPSFAPVGYENHASHLFIFNCRYEASNSSDIQKILHIGVIRQQKIHIINFTCCKGRHHHLLHSKSFTAIKRNDCSQQNKRDKLLQNSFHLRQQNQTLAPGKISPQLATFKFIIQFFSCVKIEKVNFSFKNDFWPDNKKYWKLPNNLEKINLAVWLIESEDNLWKLNRDIFRGTTKTICY